MSPETVAGKQANRNRSKSEAGAPDSDFVVTEQPSRPPDLAGVTDKQDQPNQDDELGVQSNTTLMEENANETGVTHSPEALQEPQLFDNPIGSKAPVLPPASNDARPAHKMEPEVVADQSKELRRLSDKEVRSIRSQLYSESEAGNASPTSPPVGDKDSPPLPTPFGNTPIVSPKKQSKQLEPDSQAIRSHGATKTQPNDAAPLQRRVAHYYKRFIHLPTGSRIRENDEIVFHDKLYVMRPKRLSTGLVVGLAIPMFALLVFITINLLVGGDIGNGRVVGVVVDDYGVPYDGRATIRFPELDQSYQTDSQGFFTTDQLPAGSHRIEYIVAGTVVGTEYATVVDNDITRLIIAPSAEEEAQAVSDLPSPVPAKRDYAAPPKLAAETNSPRSTRTAGAKTSGQNKPSKKAKLVLSTNVEGATLRLDGKVIGVGNTTYPRLTPGKHEYSVTRQGFDTVTGTVTLTAGSRKTIEVELSPISEQAKAEVFNAKDYFYSGEAFLASANLTSALTDYTSAIDLDPGYASAYARRAEANRRAGEKRAAFDDFLRAGEIYQIKRRYNRAATAFTSAIAIFPKAIEPILGRGHTYLSRGESIAAITDFETATSIDKRSPAARFGLGVARFNHGQYKKAIKEFKKARSLDPRNPATHQYLMLAYLARNDTKNVKKSYDKFLKGATEEQIIAFHTDRKFTAIVRVVDMVD